MIDLLLVFVAVTMSENAEQLDHICNRLDKLSLDALHLIEEEIQLKLNVENAMSGGESHIAKSRYILGRNNVSTLQLPTENSNDFSAAVKVIQNEDDKLFEGKTLELRQIKKSEDESVHDPMKWFGILVPQNLHHAQNMFRQALQWAVQAANVQLQLKETVQKIYELRLMKASLRAEE